MQSSSVLGMGNLESKMEILLLRLSKNKMYIGYAFDVGGSYSSVSMIHVIHRSHIKNRAYLLVYFSSVNFNMVVNDMVTECLQ